MREIVPRCFRGYTMFIKVLCIRIVTKFVLESRKREDN